MVNKVLAAITIYRPLRCMVASIFFAAASLSFANAEELDVREETVARVEEDLNYFVTSFSQRQSTSPQCIEAGRWLGTQFRQFGYLDVALRPFELRRGRSTYWPCNVVCEKRGTTRPDEIVIVCAHYDSVNGRDRDGLAPGADDNASGTVALLEIARQLQNQEFDRTIWFVAFAGEEQGLVGSEEMASDIAGLDRNIVLLLNLDMVGHPIDGDHTILVEEDRGNRSDENDEISQEWAEQLSNVCEEIGFDVKRDVINRSDYMPFEAIGVPCVGLYDGAADTDFYHTDQDTIEKVNLRYCASVAEASAKFLRLALNVENDDRNPE